MPSVNSRKPSHSPLKITPVLLAAAGILALSLPAISQPAAPVKSHSSCFFSQQFESWKAPDTKTIYIRVGMHHIYRLDLAVPCYPLRSPGAFLVTRLRGSSTICGPLDWDLHVATSWHSIPQACIVKAMTELSADEVKALPKSHRP